MNYFLLLADPAVTTKQGTRKQEIERAQMEGSFLFPLSMFKCAEAMPAGRQLQH